MVTKTATITESFRRRLLVLGESFNAEGVHFSIKSDCVEIWGIIDSELRKLREVAHEPS
jgi:hypothetical protein